MKVREVKIIDETNPADAGVETYPINLVDPVTEFKLWFYAKNHATGPNQNNAIPQLIKEIAVVDGSEVIQSLTGPQAVADYAFSHGRLPFSWQQQHAGMSQYAHIPLTFGRDLRDPTYIFDPVRFRNPALRIEWDLEAIAGVGANGYATGSVQFQVFANIVEEGASPSGYLMKKEVDSYTSAASGEVVTYLPTDYPIRMLMVRAYKQFVGMNETITNLKLSIDQDKWVPFNLNGDRFIWLMHNWLPEYRYVAHNEGDETDQLEHCMGEYVVGQATPDTGAEIFVVDGWVGGYYTVQTNVDNAGTDLPASQHVISARGRTPWNCYCYLFGDQADPEDWLKVRDIGSLRLILTQGNAGGAVEIVTQQEHPY